MRAQASPSHQPPNIHRAKVNPVVVLEAGLVDARAVGPAVADPVAIRVDSVAAEKAGGAVLGAARVAALAGATPKHLQDTIFCKLAYDP